MGHITFFPFSYHKITLLEKKYDIKLITSISMYHLKSLASLAGSLKIRCRCPIAVCIDTVQILCITAFDRKILQTVCVV